MKRLTFFLLTTFISLKVVSQNPTPAAPVAYGEPIKLEQAEKVATAAYQEATKNNWQMAIAIVDTGGKLVLFKKMDNTQLGSIDVALGKATTANNFKRSTKIFEESITNGGAGLRTLALSGVVPVEGGEPIIINGKVIGAIGVSGAKASEDGIVARAGISALK